jgi:hypothetical protein
VSVVLGVVLSGCFSSTPSVAYQDGFNVAAQNIPLNQTFLASGPASECSLLASQDLVPPQDSKGEWEAGCKAALAHAKFLHITAPGSN